MNKTQIILFGDNKVNIKNNNFKFNLNYWNHTSGWSYNASFNGGAKHTTGLTTQIYQPLQEITVGTEYIVYVFQHGTTGTLLPALGTASGTTINATTNMSVHNIVADGQDIIFYPSSNYNGIIYSVLIYEKPAVYGFRHELDLYDNQNLNITLQINDISDVTKKTASYSKTITLPGTKTNNAIFEYQFDINIATQLSDIYFEKKVDAVIVYDSIPIRYGFLSLKKINKLGDLIEYEVEFISNNANIAKSCGSNYIFGNEDVSNDIDVSEFDHILNISNLKHSWDSSGVSNGYIYPILDYYYRNPVSYSLPLNQIHIENLRPSLFVKVLFDKIFDKYGYTYTSSFLNSAPFTELIIPFNSGKYILDDSTIYNRYCEANLSGTYEGTTQFNVNFNIDVKANTIVQDNLSSFNTTNGRWTCMEGGVYNILFDVAFDITDIVENIDGDHYIFSGINKITLMLYRKRNNIFTLITTEELELQTGEVTLPLSYNMTIFSTDLNIRVNDEFSLILRKNESSITIYGTDIETFTTFKFTSIVFKASATDDLTYVEGNLIEMRKMFGSNKVKQIDFISSIFKMFNLWIEEDSFTKNNFYIEPREDYLLAGDNEDWTDKIDFSKGLEINRLDELINKNMRLTYSADDDELNENYTKETKEIYGTKIEYNEIMSTDELKLDIIFSPTPVFYDQYLKLPVGVFYNLTDDNPQQAEYDDKNIRILYANKIKLDAAPWNTVVKIRTNNSLYTYPALGNTKHTVIATHFDNPKNVNFDLNFGQCPKYYYDFISGNTYNNLFYLYWKKYASELLNKDSKLVTAYIKLSIQELFHFKFNHKIYIDNTWYLVNKIIDWDIDKLCKIELLKLDVSPNYTEVNPIPPPYGKINLHKKAAVLNLQKYTGISAPNIDASGNTIYECEYKDYPEYSGDTMNSYSDTSNASIIGIKNNIYASYNVNIVGDNNLIENRDTIFIIGKNNRIE